MGNSKEFSQYRPHPWHGIEIGADAPSIVTAYIEITPFDTIKFEVDKPTGFLRIDRPQKTTALPPTIYGFIPQTYCGDEVGKLAPQVGKGDEDPLDIVVVSDYQLNRADLLLDAGVIGGIQMIDGGEADDKIVAVLEGDKVYEDVKDINDLPAHWLNRLQHYFLTYKFDPNNPDANSEVSIDKVYGREREAFQGYCSFST